MVYIQPSPVYIKQPVKSKTDTTHSDWIINRIRKPIYQVTCSCQPITAKQQDLITHYFYNMIAKLSFSLSVVLLVFTSFRYQPHTTQEAITDSLPPANAMFLADPTIFHYHNMYYLYGTGGEGNKDSGFFVYTSADMHNWQGPSGTTNGYALAKGDAYGAKGFWAPQILHYKDSFYMAYAADEHIAIAQSSSPAGPFRQHTVACLSGETKQIDPYIFIDDDGKKWLYFVKLTNGNRLFVAQLKDDLSDIKPETVKECFSATQPWENTTGASWPVTEGPAVLKYKGLYYLVYSANDFRNIDYAVGYATSCSPAGP